MKYQPIVSRLVEHAEHCGDRIAIRMLRSGDVDGLITERTWTQLLKDTRIRAGQLSSIVKKGDRALLVMDTGIEFITTFYACLGLGVVAVPVSPPTANPDSSSSTRTRTVIKDCAPSIVLSSSDIVSKVRPFKDILFGPESPDWLAVESLPDASPVSFANSNAHTLAMLQYTSGSTGAPKGVRILHGNLHHNTHIMGTGLQLNTDTHIVSWLPFFHDLGLIAVLLNALQFGAETTLMSPIHFLQKPQRWLEAISKFGGTVSYAPDFAYALCAAKIPKECSFDLSTWKVASISAEPIRYQSMCAFHERFRKNGFRFTAFNPCYGLAEATVGVTAKVDFHGEPAILHVHRGALSQGFVEEMNPESDDAQALVSVGRAWFEQELLIVDPKDGSHLTEDKKIGEIQVRSNSVADSYWSQPSEGTFLEDGFLRTGDLGFLLKGELFLTGRLKDLIIVHGQNHAPQDVELTVEKISGIRFGNVVAIQVEDDIFLVAEIAGGNPLELAHRVVASMQRIHGFSPQKVYLMPPKSIVKTTSGKLQRRRTYKAILSQKTEPLFVYTPSVLNSEIRLLEIKEGRCTEERTFAELGFDSIALVQFCSELSELIGREIPATIIFDYPTPRALTTWLHQSGAQTVEENQPRVQHRATPMAIVGMSCRLGGGIEGPESFFEALKEGIDPIRERPHTRWPVINSPLVSDDGGFLEDITQFDADLFGLSERESLLMDPQHRMALELCWQAMEHAGVAPDSTKDQEIGVFFSSAPSEYSLQTLYDPTHDLSSTSGSGVHPAALSGRISYLFGLRGPSMTIDTACSSSLMALHLACSSLSQNECSTALVGGVNLMVSPHASQYFGHIGALSPTGRCRSFSADADGYVRSEGGAVLVVKRLEDALKSNDTILSVIRGSATNHDGRSNGFTAPSGTAQRAVMRKALHVSSLKAEDVGYVECHGTGTVLGDAIEAESVHSVYGSSSSVWLGAVKSNIGHTEAAAGIFGVIKASMVLQSTCLPPNLHLDTPNSVIRLPLRLPTENTDCSSRYAAVSGFGFTGSNVHLLLEKPPAVEATRKTDLILLSARTEQGLEEERMHLNEWLSSHLEYSVSAFAAHINKSRAQQKFRFATIINEETHEISENGFFGEAKEMRSLWMFSGQGSARVGMHEDFLRYPSFVQSLYQSHEWLGSDFDLLARLRGEKEGLLDTRYVQAAQCAFQIALSSIWKEWGLMPFAVVGHSLGAYSAGVVSGALSARETLLALRNRGAYMADAPEGMMVSIRANMDEIEEILQDTAFTLAAQNAPDQVVIAGSKKDCARLRSLCSLKRFPARALKVNRAFHHPLMSDSVQSWIENQSPLLFLEPSCLYFSDLHGDVISDCTMIEWGEHAEKTVRFQEAIEKSLKYGATHFLEIGADSTLGSLVQRISKTSKSYSCASLTEPNRLLKSAASLFVEGAPLRMKGGAVPVPKPPSSIFRRDSFWVDRIEMTPTLDDWVHVVMRDRAGGVVWSPLQKGEEDGFSHHQHAVVSGAMGGIGRQLCLWLAERYQMRLTLITRRIPTEEEEEYLQRVRSFGSAVACVVVDVCAENTRDVLREEITTDVDILFHLAGTTGSDAMKVKRDGLLNLEILDAQHIILFSSISAVVSSLSKGIEAYAEANSWLNQYAERKGSTTQRVQSFSWGPWHGAGMSDSLGAHYAQRGIKAISAQLGFAALDFGVQTAVSNIVVWHRPTKVPKTRLSSDSIRVELRGLIAKAAQCTPEEVLDEATFTELGIDSLVALDLVKDIEELIGYGLPTTLLYEHDTLKGLLDAIEGGVERTIPTRTEKDEKPGLPLLPTQHGFVVQHHFFPDMPCNVVLQIRVSSEKFPTINTERLQEAVRLLVVRHPILECAITRVQDEWRQTKSSEVVPLYIHPDIEDLDLGNKRLDLSKGPLFEVHCDRSHVLLLGHHVIVDAWSQKVLIEDLLHEYARLLGDPLTELAPLETTWEDVVHASQHIEEMDLPWWKEKLADGIPPQHINWQSPSSAPSAGGCSQHRHTLSEELTTALIEHASSVDITLPALVLGAWKALIFSQTGQQKVTVRVAQGRRELRLPQIERIAGSLADVFPVMTDLEADLSLVEVAQRAAKSLQEAQSHGAVSAKALAGLGTFQSSGPSGMTPFGFSFPLLPSQTEIGSLVLSDLKGAAGGGFTRLTLIAWVFENRLHCTFNYARSHLADSQVTALMETLIERLRDAPKVEEPRPKQLHIEVLKRCQLHPDRCAVGSLRYGSLARRSAFVANQLSGERIAVLGTAGEESAVAILSVLRSGGAWIPLDPNWPDERIIQVLASAEPTMLITMEAHRARAALLFSKEIVIVGDEEAEEGPMNEGEMAYIMYTSGSTGAPKGVVVHHGAVLEWLHWVDCSFMDDKDRFAWTSSLSYGGSLRQLFSPLLSGGCSVPISRDVLRDPDALIATLYEEKITLFNTVPSLMNHILRSVERCQIPNPFASLKWVLVGGEAVTADLVRRFTRTFPAHVRLGNLYGSTETIVNASWYEVIDTPSNEEMHTPIGWARAGTKVHLLNVNDGIGEIVVSGNIAQEYWRQPEQTAAVFVEHPVHGRVYRTGDLAVQNEEGALVYLGRSDSQVQVHGNRVEMTEIEHVLCNFPQVESAVVVFVEDSLRATVQSKEDISVQELRAHVAATLPHYMIPHQIQVVDTLPRNAAGKADRMQLRQETVVSRLPSDRMELMADIWQEVLGLESRPSATDNFFSLGGDSIRALEIIGALQDRADLYMPPLTMYMLQELGEMVDALEQYNPEVIPQTVNQNLSSVQRGFWTAHQRNPKRPPIWAARIPLSGVVDTDKLRAALQESVRRHEVLRTTFSLGRHGPSINVHGDSKADIQTQDLRMVPQEMQKEYLDMVWKMECQISYDMGVLPLFRVQLIQLSDEKSVLIFSAHHIIADAWSCWVLMGELLHMHDVGVGQHTLSRAPAYSLFSADQEDTHALWWQEELRSLPIPQKQELGRQYEEDISISSSQFILLQSTAKRLQTTPFILMLTAVTKAIRALTEEEDFVLSTASSGREYQMEQLKGVVGPFAKALPLRMRGDIHPHTVHGILSEASAHAQTSMASIARAAGSKAMSILGRYFLSWMDPTAFPIPTGSLDFHWHEGRFAYDTASTETALMIGVMVHNGLHINIHGGALVPKMKVFLSKEIATICGPQAALLVYAPVGMFIPFSRPKRVETIQTKDGMVELIGLPINAGQLGSSDLPRLIQEAAATTSAPVVALAGMLPSLTGLGTRRFFADKMLTTGHTLTVVAMFLNTQSILKRLGLKWERQRVGVLGYGSIGKACLELCISYLGEPVSISICDPKYSDSVPDLYGCTLILGATSGGASIDVQKLVSGTIVIDDSFPPAFSIAQAKKRMDTSRDVLLMGGGTFDLGRLERSSPFPQAKKIRAEYGSRWIPGCMAEAILLGLRPELGPTVGIVTLERAQKLLGISQELGWRAAKPHLDTWDVPKALLDTLMELYKD